MLGAALADPNVAFLLLVLGALGVYWEVHAPGMLLPGLLGVLLICTGAYGIYQDSPSSYGLTLLVLATILLIIELRYYTRLEFHDGIIAEDRSARPPILPAYSRSKWFRRFR
jgi:membrane-bound ClpP family serine protease